jgi:nicotinate-nucleotide adenylyltransferase
MSTLKSEHERGVLGILGGTFDPIHNAHLQLADAAWQTCGIDELRWIPAGQPPHRAAPGANAEQRLTMVRLAVAGRPNESVDAAEVESPVSSYSVVTLERLRAELGAARPLALVLGADAFLGLPSWHRWEEIFSLAHLIVTERPGTGLGEDTLPAGLQPHWRQRRAGSAEALKRSPSGSIFTFPMPPCPLSASEIRARLKAGDSVAGLLPAPVLDYIRQHSLYR